MTDVELTVDKDVTVLTGPNDVGKSLALRAIEILCTPNTISYYEVNRYRTRVFKGTFSDDGEVACVGHFEITAFDKDLPRVIKSGSVIKVERRMTLSEGTITEFQDKDSISGVRHPLAHPPMIIKLPVADQVRQEINFLDMNEAEKHFVSLGFGDSFLFEEHRSLDQVERSYRVAVAQEALNGMLARILPTAMPLRFHLFEINADPQRIGVGLIDKFNGHAFIASRGAGVRRLLNVMGAMLRIDADRQNAIVLYDEPEASLHADFQHALRRLLEGIASHPNIQVVYSTHSPAMINSLRPESIRLLERRQEGDEAVSRFVNNAFGGNFLMVRSSLGMTPADSLLYGSITIIVEGITEVYCIPLILKKLYESRIIDPLMTESLLSQAHILDGEGEKYEHYCRMAQSQNANPVVFVDGDKQSKLKRLEEKYPDMPVVSLSAGMELEDMVPRSKYIQAVGEVLEDRDDKINEQAYESWVMQADLRPTVMLSKRIERWLRDVFDLRLQKVPVMARAIELTDAKDIKKEPFEQLVEAMRKVAGI